MKSWCLFLVTLLGMVAVPSLLAQDSPVKVTDTSVVRGMDNRSLDGHFTLHNLGSGKMSALQVTVEFLDGSGQPILLQDIDGSMVPMALRVTDLPASLDKGKSRECFWTYTYMGTITVIQTRYVVKGKLDRKPFTAETEPESYGIPLWPSPFP